MIKSKWKGRERKNVRNILVGYSQEQEVT